MRRIYLRASIVFYLLLLLVIPTMWYVFFGRVSDKLKVEYVTNAQIFVGSCNIHIVNSPGDILYVDSWVPKNIRAFFNPSLKQAESKTGFDLATGTFSYTIKNEISINECLVYIDVPDTVTKIFIDCEERCSIV